VVIKGFPVNGTDKYFPKQRKDHYIILILCSN